jgi:excisionase family DNA binding protein
MSTLEERIDALIQAMPDGASITLSRSTLVEWRDTDTTTGGVDLTVQQVAERMHRSAECVRQWIRSGDLAAYKFRGNEYRVTEIALDEFQRQQRGKSIQSTRCEVPSDLGRWRQRRHQMKAASANSPRG